jgi:hypothetical protein
MSVLTVVHTSSADLNELENNQITGYNITMPTKITPA